MFLLRIMYKAPYKAYEDLNSDPNDREGTKVGLVDLSLSFHNKSPLEEEIIVLEKKCDRTKESNEFYDAVLSKDKLNDDKSSTDVNNNCNDSEKYEKTLGNNTIEADQLIFMKSKIFFTEKEEQEEREKNDLEENADDIDQQYCQSIKFGEHDSSYLISNYLYLR